ncbi:MAG: hypothetical protein ACP5VN_07060 [Acidobacteriota bacterium]
MSAPPIRNEPIRLPDRRGTADLLRIFALAAAALAPAALYVHLASRHIEAEYRLSRLVEERTLLTRERDRLALVKASLLAPQEVRRVAREALGMVEEDPQEWTVGVEPPPPPAQEARDKGTPSKPKSPPPGHSGRRR